jgi:hypothetical protein
MVKSVQYLQSFLKSFENMAWEPAIERYQEHLIQLNKIVEDSGEKIEGNLFYYHEAPSLPNLPEQGRRFKRRNYAVYASSGTSLIEIGFNAGHSCLLALSVNEDLIYTGVDIGWHKYTVPCYEYLKTAFGDRVNLVVGDSREVLPSLRHLSPLKFDLFHIDGGHGVGMALTDLINIIDMASIGSTILFDDTPVFELDALLDYLCVRGILSRVYLSRLWEGNEQALLRVEADARRARIL